MNTTSLSENTVKRDPIEQFIMWFNTAKDRKLPYNNAMNLSTVAENGRPSGRIVLLKDVDQEGFKFFTNYNSRKSKELDINPYASLTIFWLGLEKQVRVEGKVHRLNDELSDTYFSLRPRGSQIGAWASNQSALLKDRNELDQRMEEFTNQFDGKDVPRPPHWGGYCLVPDKIEFWDNVPNRLHDRLVFSLINGDWKMERLAP